MHRTIVAACATVLALTPLTGMAQGVRGVVKERDSGIPLSGVLVTLTMEGGGDAPVVSTLSTDVGAFTLRAPQAGRYLLGAKRIGVLRFESEPIELAEEVVEFDVELEALVHRLPTVTVHSDPLCVRRADQAARVASLWDEASTALEATRISVRDRLVRMRVTRYTRDLNPQNLRVEADRGRREVAGVVEQPFVSLPADMLSRNGYWRALPNDSIEYYAPDATVLLSTAFARDHCFGIVEGRGERAGLAGMVFEPAERRGIPDVRGTIWLDAETFELQLVEFGYTRLPIASSNRHIGGEVHFAKLPGGAWIVERWFIRMPRYDRTPRTRSTGIPGQPPIVEYRLLGLIEEGGTVTVERSSSTPPRHQQ
jgi:hypothetical protein